MKKKICILFTFMMTVLLLLAACAKKDASFSSGSDKSAANGEMTAPQEASAPNVDFTTADGQGIANTSAITSGTSGAESLDKIIRRIKMDVETQDFDNLINTLDDQIKSLGGYVESSNITGHRYYYDDDYRYAEIVARVPKDRVDEFVNTVYGNSNVVNKNESTENVTLQYVDTQSRIKSLQVEQDRLLNILEKTDTLDNIITLENRLSDIRYQLESYQSQIRVYDNQVEYSTVTLSVSEVERMTPAEGKKESVWSRIRTGFGDTMYHISEGLKNFFVWFIVNLPYLIIWAAVITGGILIGRRIYRKSQKKRNITGSGPDMNRNPNLIQNQNQSQNQSPNQTQNQNQNQNQNRPGI